MAATLDTVLQKQDKLSILESPSQHSRPVPHVAQTQSTLNISLQNDTRSSNLYAYVTGLAINNNYSVFILQADGVTPYYPTSPLAVGASLVVNCAIPLGGPGVSRTVAIPQLAGGRIWFAVDNPLTFLLNPGPGLVEPSVTNPSDPNINTYWDFCELTFNSAQAFVNVTYVDFVCLPISLTLTNTSGGTQHVSGILADGLDTICSGLRAQDAIDNAGWSNLIINSPSGSPIRAMSPNNGIVMNLNLFTHYYDSYVNDVWNKYTNTNLTINTQASWGVVRGEVSGNDFVISGVGSWGKPAARDIFSCNSVPFSDTAGEIGNISARLCAAFNRSTLLTDTNQPDGEIPINYYQTNPTNHYSRIVHAANLDSRGYAFPYDDVVPSGGADLSGSGGADLSGSVADGSPQLLTVSVGGMTAHTKLRRRRDLQVEAIPEPLSLPSQKHIGW